MRSPDNLCCPELQDALSEAERARRMEHSEYERLQKHANFLEENNRHQADTISMYRKRDEDASIARQYEDDAKRLRKEEIETERRRYCEQLASEFSQDECVFTALLIYHQRYALKLRHWKT